MSADTKPEKGPLQTHAEPISKFYARDQNDN